MDKLDVQAIVDSAKEEEFVEEEARSLREYVAAQLSKVVGVSMRQLGFRHVILLYDPLSRDCMVVGDLPRGETKRLLEAALLAYRPQ